MFVNINNSFLLQNKKGDKDLGRIHCTPSVKKKTLDFRVHLLFVLYKFFQIRGRSNVGHGNLGFVFFWDGGSRSLVHFFWILPHDIWFSE